MILPPGLGTRCGECLLYAAIQGLADGLILVDPQGRVFHMNRRAEELLGVRAARAMGRPLRSSIRQPALLAFWRSAAGESRPVTTDLTLPPRRAIRATVSVCLSAGRQPIGRALLLRDVTREKRIHIELSSSVARRLVELAGGEASEADHPPLTPRQREILALLAGGLSNAAIAGRLHVSVNTVASHLKHLYARLKISSRSQAAAYALTHGFRPPPK
ncbi:MAG: LuxR C-terminal-related transcriptional regulator [Acidobacteriota bacterium]